MGELHRDTPKVWELSKNKSTQSMYCEHDIPFLEIPSQTHQKFPLSYGFGPYFSGQVKEKAFCNKVNCPPCSTFKSAVSFFNGFFYPSSRKNAKGMVTDLQDYLTNFNLTLEKFAWKEPAKCPSQMGDPKENYDKICENNGGKLLMKLLFCDIELLFQHFDIKGILEYLLETKENGMVEFLKLTRQNLGYVPLSDQVTLVYILKRAFSSNRFLKRIDLNTRDFEFIATLPLVYACYQTCFLETWKYEAFDFSATEDFSNIPAFDSIAQTQLDSYLGGVWNIGYRDQRFLKGLYCQLQSQEKNCIGKIDEINRYLVCKFFNPDFALLEEFLTVKLPEYCQNLYKDSSNRPFLKYCGLRDAKIASSDSQISKFYSSEIWADLISWHNEKSSSHLLKGDEVSSSFKTFQFLDAHRFEDTTSEHSCIQANYLLCLLDAFCKVSLGTNKFEGVDNHFYDGKLFIHAKTGLQDSLPGYGLHPCNLDIHFYRHLWQNLQECVCSEIQVQSQNKGKTKAVTFKYFAARRTGQKQGLCVIDTYVTAPSEYPLVFCECCDKLECLRRKPGNGNDDFDGSDDRSPLSDDRSSSDFPHFKFDELQYLRHSERSLIPYIALKKVKIDVAKYNRDIERSKDLNAERELIADRIMKGKDLFVIPFFFEVLPPQGSYFLNKPFSWYESEIFSGELTCKKSPECFFRHFTKTQKEPLIHDLIQSSGHLYSKYERQIFTTLSESSDQDKVSECDSLPSLESVKPGPLQPDQDIDSKDSQTKKPDTPTPRLGILVRSNTGPPEILENPEPCLSPTKGLSENDMLEIAMSTRKDLLTELEQFLSILKQRTPDWSQNRLLEDVLMTCYKFNYDQQSNNQ